MEAMNSTPYKNEIEQSTKPVRKPMSTKEVDGERKKNKSVWWCWITKTKKRIRSTIFV